MGVKMRWIQIKMGPGPLAQNGASLTPFVLTEHTLVTHACAVHKKLIELGVVKERVKLSQAGLLLAVQTVMMVARYSTKV